MYTAKKESSVTVKSLWKGEREGENLSDSSGYAKGGAFAGSGYAKAWFRFALTVLCTGPSLWSDF
jgi:hypothetical protein